MRMSASWSGSQDPPNTRLWRDDLAPAAWFPSRRRLAEPMAPRGLVVVENDGLRYGAMGRAQPVVFHDQSVGIAQGAKRPNEARTRGRLDENAFFLLTKKTPYKVG